MLRKCFVFALVAVSLAVASASVDLKYTTKVADRDLLVKQKKLLDLLMYVENNVLTDTEFFEIGRNYDIKTNIDRYTNREVVIDFLSLYNLGLLSKDGLFTYYNQEHREEMLLLYRLLYTAKDFNTFYKTACWARLHLNSALFTTALTTAVIYRDDTKYIRLPAIYEIYPNMFFDSKVVRNAQRIMMTRGSTGLGRQLAGLRKTDVLETVETFHLYSNFSDICLSPTYNNYEDKLLYFTQDIGLNAYYYYFRMMFPFWVNTKEYEVPKALRGDLYYFVHQQLLARYQLERVSNGLGELEDFTWDRMSLPGFYSNILYSNGIAMPRRDWWNLVPLYKQKYLEYLKKLETRILEAIDSGFVIDELGKQVNIMTPEGLNILGNLIEGNYDSLNLKYYGAFDVLSRKILGNNFDTKNKDLYVPSSLELFSSSLKDPAFYRLYSKIVQFFLRYKSLLNRYTKNELELNGVKIENVEIDKLLTFFDTKDFLVNNLVDVPSMKDGRSFNIKAWQYHLNYKPFTYKFNINSDKNTKAVIRIFLGPTVEGEKYDDYSYLLHYYKYFFMLDEFEVNLREGLNNIDRLSTDSILIKKEYLTGDRFYKKILQAIEGKEPLNLDECLWGFPEHLLLPKGSVNGLRFKLFFYIGSAENGRVIELPILGKRLFYGQSLGFPLDRPVQPWLLKLDNVLLKDVLIYNLGDDELLGGRSVNLLQNYDNLLLSKDRKDSGLLSQNLDYDSKTRDVDSLGRLRDINMMHI